jgi:amino acid adenylation domain-containing protein
MAVRTPVARRPSGIPVPASMAQERFWFIDQVRRGTPVHNLAYGMEIRGELDIEAIRRALDEIVARHEVLRLRFDFHENQLVQRFAEHKPLDLALTDFHENGSLAEKHIAGIAHEPFDLLGGDALFRVALQRLAGDHHRLVLVAHHAVFDGWSLGVLVTELVALYRAFATTGEVPLPPLDLQFGDYAVWEAEAVADGALAEQRAYWTEELTADLAPLDLPLDAPRPAVARHRGDTVRFTVPAKVTGRMRALATEESATLFMVSLAAFQVLMFRHTGQPRFTVGSPVANRHDERLADLIGPFINVLVLRADFTGDPTFRDILLRVRRTVANGYANQELPLQRLVGELAPDRDLDNAPLFRVALAFQNFTSPVLDLGGELTIRPFPVEVTSAQNDLSLFLEPDGDRLTGFVRYNADIFLPGTVARLVDDFLRLLNQLTMDPELPVRRLVLAEPAPLVRADLTDPVPPSVVQEHRFGARGNHVWPTGDRTALAVDLDGEVRVDALRAALRTVEDRYEELRTTFASEDGDLRPHRHPAGRATLEVLDTAEPDTAGFLLAPMDLATGSPLLARLVRLGEPAARSTAVLMVAVHRLVADERSARLVVRDILDAYHGDDLEPAPNLRYQDYALWQRRGLSGRRRADLVAYWRARLGDAPATVGLPTRPPSGPTAPAAAVAFGLPPGLADPLDAVLAATAVLLGRYGGGLDVVLGTPTDHRDRAELRDLVGPLTTLLPVRVTAPETAGFGELVTLVGAAREDAARHRELPFEALVELLDPVTEEHRHPLCQVVVTVADPPVHPGVRVLAAETMAVDLVIEVGDAGGQVRYRTDLFDRTVAAALADHLAHLLARFAADPDQPVGQVPTLPPAEARAVLAGCDATDVVDPDETVHGLFERHAAETPEALAVVADGRRLTYAELDAAANRLANGLVARGVEAGQRVALLLDGGVLAITALFGVLKAGAVFVCVDPLNPSARVARLLAEIRPALVLTDAVTAGTHADSLAGVLVIPLDATEFADQPTSRPDRTVGPADPAYLAYTSGSTGTPKGIPHAHRDLAQFVRWQARALPVTATSRMAQLAALPFDVAYCEIFGALCSGAALSVRARGDRADATAIARRLRADGVTVVQVISRLFREVLLAIELDGDPAGTALETVVFVGEALPAGVVAETFRVLGPGVRVVNIYGPTEVVAATCHVLDEPPSPEDGGVVPIGRPIDGRQVLVLDGSGRLCPPGVTGEIWVRSRYLSPGYPEDEHGTRRRFLPCPVPGVEGTCYRTGDLGRRRRDGTLEFAGRVDNQVKLHGVRLELEEVEAAVIARPAVRECVAHVHSGEHMGDQSQRLVVYVVADPELDPDALRAELRATLPRHMVPAEVRTLDRLPRTMNGKVDRHALPAPSGPVTAGRAYLAPRTPLETELADLCREVLGVARVGVDDDFFELGGNSLHAAQLANRIRQRYGVEVGVPDLFAHPTVAATAAATEAARRALRDEDRLARIEERLARLSDDEVLAMLAEEQDLTDSSEEGTPR